MPEHEVACTKLVWFLLSSFKGRVSICPMSKFWISLTNIWGNTLKIILFVPQRGVAWPNLVWFLLAPSICNWHTEKEKIKEGAFNWMIVLNGSPTLNCQIEVQIIVQQERASNTPFEVSTQLNRTYKVPTDKKQPQARYVSPALPIHSLQLFILAFQIVFQPLLCQSRYCSCGIFSQVLQTAVGGGSIAHICHKCHNRRWCIFS